jgi:3-(3-hydroxy-phenyl)propionate hydroxylase
VTADVVVVGFGPVGAALALRLAQRGLSVVVVERSPEPYPLPRAVAVDGEVFTLLRRLDASLVDGFLPDREVRFVSRGRELGSLRFPSWHGAPGLSFLSQPALERRLRQLCHAAGVVVTTGDVVALRGTTAALADGSDVEGRWVVGCDGASSTVRRLVGAGWHGRDLPGTWLVADVAWQGRDRFTYTLDPALPQVDMPTPEGHRWEWLGADPSDLERLLARDGCHGAEVIRAVPYSFAARRAGSWQVGRVLLAGDAAHVMPPFAGQGLSSGLRDAWALGQLLARSPADHELAAYQRLREPHVRQVTRLSLLLGAVVTTRRSGARDALLRGAFAAPGLGPWLRRGGPRPADSRVLRSG